MSVKRDGGRAPEKTLTGGGVERKVEASAQVGEERDRCPPLSSQSSSFSSAFLSGFLLRKKVLDPLQPEPRFLCMQQTRAETA